MIYIFSRKLLEGHYAQDVENADQALRLQRVETEIAKIESQIVDINAHTDLLNLLIRQVEERIGQIQLETDAHIKEIHRESDARITELHKESDARMLRLNLESDDRVKRFNEDIDHRTSLLLDLIKCTEKRVDNVSKKIEKV